MSSLLELGWECLSENLEQSFTTFWVTRRLPLLGQQHSSACFSAEEKRAEPLFCDSPSSSVGFWFPLVNWRWPCCVLRRFICLVWQDVTFLPSSTGSGTWSS